MKKFTHLISRSITRTTSADVELPAPYEANCFHQLTSSRLRHGDSFQRSSTRAALSRIVANEANFKHVCWTCKGIDFPKVLSWQHGDSRPWVPLAHTLSPEFPDCPYCNFFRAMIGSEGITDGSGKFTPYLRIRMAFEKLGVSEKHELAYDVLFEVMCRNKSLPEGYLVRTAEDESDTTGYNAIMYNIGIRGRTVKPRLDPAVPKAWLDFCKGNHQKTACARFEPLVEGLRLIDCENHRLVNTADFDSDFIEYTTLSYVWGDMDRDVFVDEGDNLFDDTPQIIGDAIYLSEVLGFRYLWVDRVCLSKLDEQERIRQTRLTGEIFAQSALTIVVAAGSSVDDGIPGISVARQAQMSLQVGQDVFTTSLVRPDLEIASSVWATRGWTFQEAALARRRLVITPSQAYFQCQAVHCHESLSVSLHYAPGLDLGRVFPETGAGTQPEHLRHQIKTYITKEFTHPQDRLLAFEAILRHYSQLERGVDNLVGLPLFNACDFSSSSAPVDRVTSRTDRLATGLGWLPEPTNPSQTHTNPYALAYDELFPSWSWLAWRLRTGHSIQNNTFKFNLADESVPQPFEGVGAAPMMEIGIGFEDGQVLPWEADEEDAIGTKTERVTFLRLKTFTFDLTINKDTGSITMPTTPSLPLSRKEAIKSWFQHSYASPPCPPASPATESTTAVDDAAIPNGRYALTALLLAGRNWTARGPGERSATILVCGRKSGGRLVRLGAMNLPFGTFVKLNEDTAVLEDVEMDGSGKVKGELRLRLKELDIY